MKRRVKRRNPLLDPTSRWMAKKALDRITKGANVADVVSSLRAQGYNKIAFVVEREAKGKARRNPKRKVRRNGMTPSQAKALIGKRVEIPVHYNKWMQGARYGEVTAFRQGKPGTSAALLVKLDKAPKTRLKVWALDWPYLKVI